MDRKDDVIPENLVHALLGALRDPADAKPTPSLRQRILDAAAREPAIVVVRAGEGEWHPIAPGVSAKVLYDDGIARTWLARMGPETSLPAHDHPADEECLVLEGTMEVDGIRVAAGDYQVAMRGTSHGPVHSTTGCLLLVRSASA